ncbi:Protein RST1 [Linum perenne]
MDAYAPLLEKTKVPQPSLQKFAVVSIFSKLRTAPNHLDANSEPGREAISNCLQSRSPAVVDQAVRELCRLVFDSKLDLSRGMIELQSALEGTENKFVALFVKGLMFLVRLGFDRSHGSWRFTSSENHPLVKILLCRSEVQPELVQQVLMFMAKDRGLGMVDACEFLRPLLNFSVLSLPFSDSLSSLFARRLISSMASFCCSFPDDGIPILRLLVGGLKFLPRETADELRNSYYFIECTADAYIVVLRHLVGKVLSEVTEVQQLGVELAETTLSLLDCDQGRHGGSESIFELLKRLFVVQKDLGLEYIPELSAALLSLSTILAQSELEHEQLSLLKLLIFLFRWKKENDSVSLIKPALSEELVLMFPVLNLMSSTSKSVKAAASDLIGVVENCLVHLLKESNPGLCVALKFPHKTTVGTIMYRLLQHLWVQGKMLKPTSCYMDLVSFVEMHDEEKQTLGFWSWASKVREYCLRVIDKRKSSVSLSQFEEVFLKEMPQLLSAVGGVLVIHQLLGNDAVDLLAAVGIMDPKLGVGLLLSVLFYISIFTRKDVNYQSMLPQVLAMLPSLAAHNMMVPLVIQTIMPMLQMKGKQVLYATGTRLLYHTWAVNDRAFVSLQAALLPNGFSQLKSERTTCISLAASIRDVCRENPDRGVDLILSVSACIESRDPTIQALGFQGLAHLCEADVVECELQEKVAEITNPGLQVYTRRKPIQVQRAPESASLPPSPPQSPDFYTAWDVIAKDVLDYSIDPVLAQSLCFLLKWGALDAGLYVEASTNILQMLWLIAVTSPISNVRLWTKTRSSAFEALAHYEVSHVQKAILDFKKENTNFLICETNLDVLRAMEGLEVKIIRDEHLNRRRLIKEKKVARSKIEKLLDVLPRVIFPSERKGNAGQLPGAALLLLSFTPKEVTKQGPPKVTVDNHAQYEIKLAEIAASLQLSRNIFVALLSLESWKSFMSRWMNANVSSLDVKTSSIGVDKASKAANDILKSAMRLAEESLPRSAENMALAIGALCAVLPTSAHTVKSAASNFLLNWLFQHEHEHRQWSAAISLGLITTGLHVTDHKQKFENINGLLEVLCMSTSTLVKGACGVSLGFSCEDLLTRVDDSVNKEKEHYKLQEVDLLSRIISALLLMTSQLSEASNDFMEGLSAYPPLGKSSFKLNMGSKFLVKKSDELGEDVWGVAGLILGLGFCVGAMYRAGAYDAILKMKDLIISWIPHVDVALLKPGFLGEEQDKVLSVGSCLALPNIVAFCLKVEMMDGVELDHLLHGYEKLITELLSVKSSGTFHQSLLAASCIGAGSLLACILKEGVHPVDTGYVKRLLELFRSCYTNPYPSMINLGGMLGLVNAMGGAVGVLVHYFNFSSQTRSVYDQDSSCLVSPLVSSPACETNVTSLVQELFLVAQNSSDLIMQQNAAWALSFLRNHLWSHETKTIDSTGHHDSDDSRRISQSFPDDSLVVKLSMWLLTLNYAEAGNVTFVANAATVLRCLSRAPRLPAVDWGSIIRRCMRYEAQVSTSMPSDSDINRATLREECLQFSISHANQFDQLLTFLDELSLLSRFRTLELNLQSCLLVHLAGLIKVFSGSRLLTLFDDIMDFFSSDSSCNKCSLDQKSFLRVSCWKGICDCLDEVSLDSMQCISSIERCMEVLFALLPSLEFAEICDDSSKEWIEAVRCFTKARGAWLSNFLQVPLVYPVEGDGQYPEVLKKIQAKARLARMSSMPLTELGKLKSYLLNSNSDGVWNVLVEVVAALQRGEGSTKRQWLIDAVEISCVSTHPSTALRFVGLLSGICCKYMPLLTFNTTMVLSDLPVTLTTLLKEPSWEAIAASISSSLCASTERVYEWVMSGYRSPPIDESEKENGRFLLCTMRSTCIYLKDHLPLEKQLLLANMVIRD